MRHLVNEDGLPFDADELSRLRSELDDLADEARVQFRNENARTIAQHGVTKLLIVSGPGTGKSTVFKHRIVHWLENNQSAKILVLSFVRKLVTDLKNDIQNATELSEEQKTHVEVHTLHRYARSVVEKNHGSSELKFQSYLRIIPQSWKHVVWQDAMHLAKQTDVDQFSWEKFEKQLHDTAFETSSDWSELKDAYFTLSRFYNAAGFADLILHATYALSENEELKEYQFFIIDEYQDFNQAEENLIGELTTRGEGKLIVGDDDQVLYDKLKSGKAQLIRGIYTDREYVNSMLPFCSRSSSVHIVQAAESFLQYELEPESIPKIYLPLKVNDQGQRVQVIACAAPKTAVDYIKRFIESNKPEIEQRKTDLENGTKKDSFLLILTPEKDVKFYAMSKAGEELKKVISVYKSESVQYSGDFFRGRTYYSLSSRPADNFIFRKVIYYEGFSREVVGGLLKRALVEGTSFSALRDSEPLVDGILKKCDAVKSIIDAASTPEQKVEHLATLIDIFEPDTLLRDLTRQELNAKETERSELEEEVEAEVEELQRMSAVELISLVGAKGLSADHVIIIGFDNVNMSWITRNAFYVALTRARESLHLITSAKAGGSSAPHPFLTGLPEDNLELYKYVQSKPHFTSLKNKPAFTKYFEQLIWAASQQKKKSSKKSPKK